MNTATLRVLCEGPTEQGFVTQVLRPHLEQFRVCAKAESLPGGKGGGIIPFDRLRAAIKSDIGRSRPHEFVTTMLDLYALGNYPGNSTISGEAVTARVARIETEMAATLPNSRFLPYVQLHEFEALVLVDPDQLLSQFPDGEADGAPDRLRASMVGLAPEEVNDGVSTAPSKRIIKELPEYEFRKASAGPIIAKRIGLKALRAACPHFDTWISKLEGLA